MQNSSNRARSRVDSPNFRPRYRHHRSGQARVTIDGRDIYLGRFGTPASHEAYDRVIREWLDQGRSLPNLKLVGDDGGEEEKGEITVIELLAAHWQMLKDDGFVKPGDIKKNKHVGNYRKAIEPLRKFFPATPVSQFGPLALRKVRAMMIEQRLSCSTTNARVNMIRSIFQWGVSMELVPTETHQKLMALKAINEKQFPELASKPVQPVAEADVAAILPHLSSQVATMVQLQWLTGMRPGEVCAMRVGDIDLKGEKLGDVLVWVYRPEHHKTEHHGRERTIPLGPRCQALLKPFLKADPAAWLFSPSEAEAARRAEQRANRATPLWPSHQKAQAEKKAARTPRALGDSYDVHVYRRAIERACKKAGVEIWTPHQLRHAAATRIRHSHGIEAARVLLGHSSPATTEIYAQMDRSKAVSIMAEEG